MSPATTSTDSRPWSPGSPNPVWRHVTSLPPAQCPFCHRHGAIHCRCKQGQTYVQRSGGCVRLVFTHLHSLVADTELRRRNSVAHTSRNARFGQQVLPGFLMAHLFSAISSSATLIVGLSLKAISMALARFRVKVSFVPCARA